jgi:hypothetical protein
MNVPPTVVSKAALNDGLRNRVAPPSIIAAKIEI